MSGCLPKKRFVEQTIRFVRRAHVAMRGALVAMLPGAGWRCSEKKTKKASLNGLNGSMEVWVRDSDGLGT